MLTINNDNIFRSIFILNWFTCNGISQVNLTISIIDDFFSIDINQRSKVHAKLFE